MVIQKVYQAQLEVVDALEETERNEGGFGHTGV
jgi:dUTP pyrophosphatase